MFLGCIKERERQILVRINSNQPASQSMSGSALRGSKPSFPFFPLNAMHNLPFHTIQHIPLYCKLFCYIGKENGGTIDKLQTGNTELTKTSRVWNCVHLNSFINDDVFV